MPILVVAPSKTWVYGRLRAGTGGSNPAEVADVCHELALCVVRYRSLLRADHSSKRLVPSVMSKPQQWGDRGRRELSSREKKYCRTIPDRLRVGRAPQSAESPKAAIDSRLKYEKFCVGFSDKRYRVINLSLSVL